MIKFEKIKPGMTLYDVRKAAGLNKFNSNWGIWHIKIIEVHPDTRTVLASWNGNKPEIIHEFRVTRYRAKLPRDVK